MTYKLSNVVREPIDKRDFIASVPVKLNLPDGVDHRRYTGAVEDQLTTGSCVANSGASLLETLLQRAGRFVDLSRLQLYWDIREKYENLRGKDSGAYLSDAFKSVYSLGIAPESEWPFDVANVNVKPTASVYASALNLKVTKYERVAQWGDNIDAQYQVMRIQAMLAMGYTVAISTSVSSAIFEMRGKLTDATCQYSPAMTTKLLGSAGGHAMHVVGYMTIGGVKWFIVENSWGVGYGDKGYFLMHPDTLKADGYDAWTVTEFAGITVTPDWSAQPEPPLVVTIPTSSKIHYLESKDDKIVVGDAMEATISGGVAPYAIKWAASHTSIGFVTPGETTRPIIITGGMAPGAIKSFTVTVQVIDRTIPTQQVAYASTKVNVCNSVNIESDYGKVYRLYMAAFGRTPDKGGLAFWLGVLDNGTSLRRVAECFIDSDEYRSIYGLNPTNRDFALLLYTNVLHRAPDEEGIAWWINQLDSGVAKVDVLIGFSESPENKLGAQW